MIIIIILKLNLKVNPRQDLGYWSRMLIQVGWLTQINIYIKIIIIIILKLNLKINLHQNLDQKSRVTQDKTRGGHLSSALVFSLYSIQYSSAFQKLP